MNHNHDDARAEGLAAAEFAIFGRHTDAGWAMELPCFERSEDAIGAFGDWFDQARVQIIDRSTGWSTAVLDGVRYSEIWQFFEHWLSEFRRPSRVLESLELRTVENGVRQYVMITRS